MTAQTWIDQAGPELIDKVLAQVQANPAFLADARADVNAALKKHMGIDFPVRLRVYGEGDGEYVADVPETARLGDMSEELSDMDLDLVSAGTTTTCSNDNRNKI